MNVDDVQKLKFDRRMERRRDWLKPGEMEAHLEALSDAKDKIYEPTEEETAEASAEATPDSSEPGTPSV